MFIFIQVLFSSVNDNIKEISKVSKGAMIIAKCKNYFVNTVSYVVMVDQLKSHLHAKR